MCMKLYIAASRIKIDSSIVWGKSDLLIVYMCFVKGKTIHIEFFFFCKSMKTGKIEAIFLFQYDIDENKWCIFYNIWLYYSRGPSKGIMSNLFKICCVIHLQNLLVKGLVKHNFFSRVLITSIVNHIDVCLFSWRLFYKIKSVKCLKSHFCSLRFISYQRDPDLNVPFRFTNLIGFLFINHAYHLATNIHFIQGDGAYSAVIYIYDYNFSGNN